MFSTLFRKITLLLIAIIATLTFQLPTASTVHAQDKLKIKYGETVNGEVTKSKFAFDYTFTGKKGDVIVIKLGQDGFDSNVDPEIFLLSDSKENLASTVEQISIFTATLAFELPDDGNFTIRATREKGKDGDSVGKFKLTLLLAEPLVAGKSTTATVASDVDNYYTFQTGDAFSVSYEKGSGDFNPAVSINTVEAGALKSAGELQGKGMKKASMTLVPEFNTQYVVRVGTSFSDFNFDVVKADYKIMFGIDK